MATYTFDVFSSLDGYGAAVDWPGYWGKEGPELLAQRAQTFAEDQILVLGATTYQVFARILQEEQDPTFDRLREMPKVVLSTTLEPPLSWENSTLVREDALTAIPRLKAESDVPLRSHGSLSMNRALMAAGLVDRLEVMLFPVITGVTGRDPIFVGALDFDLELVETRTFDGRVQQLIYVPTLHEAST
ncbi:dihydrofolate reductase family protein [Rhodococcus chondri]|uniref:Dihydrofolate reductase family protein n=1 Tax=Rhodococcus chondri TaxID=3065941 RepID=A0ABU7JLK8_9NOCA|nr:dihydrofolate reductase family protein [Rhodococcus sp. CC-R104]MEE2030923.1 dihydrofolate reductase family protein [Rhodococcus sp. CC-R104]